MGCASSTPEDKHVGFDGVSVGSGHRSKSSDDLAHGFKKDAAALSEALEQELRSFFDAMDGAARPSWLVCCCWTFSLTTDDLRTPTTDDLRTPTTDDLLARPPRMTFARPPRMTFSRPPRMTFSRPPRMTFARPPRMTFSRPPRLPASALAQATKTARCPRMRRSRSGARTLPR